MIYDPPRTGDLILPFAQQAIHCVDKVNTNNEMQMEGLNQFNKTQQKDQKTEQIWKVFGQQVVTKINARI